jgi:MFS family permease
VGWLVLQLSGSATVLGLVLAAGSLPTLVLGPWGGVAADRLNLRRLLLATQVVFALLAAGLWLLAARGEATIAWLVGIGAVTGLVAAVDGPARQAFAGTLVPAEYLASAISLNGVLINTARVVGPAVAGVLIATVGTTVCFAVNAVSYAAIILALLVIRPTTQRRAAAGGGVLDGLRYARGIVQLWLPLSMTALVGLLAFNFQVVIPVFARDAVGGDGGTFGLLSALLSLGAVAGSLAVGAIPHPRRLYLVATATVFAAGLTATAAATTVPLAGAALVLTGAAAFAFITLVSTTLQLHAAPQYRGRVIALFGLVYMGTTPIGSPLTGWIISVAGPRAALLVGAVACLTAAVGAALVRTPPAPEDHAGAA